MELGKLSHLFINKMLFVEEGSDDFYARKAKRMLYAG